MSDPVPHYRRNFACLAGDWVCFVTGMAFISYTSVIPSFVNQLTDFAPLVGLAATLPNGVWLLPQLVAANYVGGRERKKPWVIATALVGRPMYLAVGLFAFVAGRSYPWLLLALFLLVETAFSTLDGLGNVAWFDVLGKVIPARRRGRFYVTAQGLSGLLSMGAGVVVARVLGSGGPPFPRNYALLFGWCAFFLLLSLTSFVLVKEPIQETRREREPWRVYLPRLASLFRQDQQFRLINLVRMVAAVGGLAVPFYVIHATDVLRLGTQTVGLFVAAQMVGGVVASLAMGYLNERSGSRIVSQLTLLLGVGSPLVALAAHYFPLPQAIQAYGYALVFFFIGAMYSGYMQGFTNFVLDISPQEERPAYVGLFNTLGGTVVFVAPLLGGWLLQFTSYPVLFSAAAVGSLSGLALSSRLREPRTHRTDP
jgi:MFS family permease